MTRLQAKLGIENQPHNGPDDDFLFNPESPGQILREVDGRDHYMQLYGMMWRGKPEDIPITLAAPESDPTVTMYDAWKWAEPEELKEAGERGSLCVRLLYDWLEGKVGIGGSNVPLRR